MSGVGPRLLAARLEAADQKASRIGMSRLSIALQDRFVDALIDNCATAVESFGRVRVKRYGDRRSQWLAQEGDPREAVQVRAVHDKTRRWPSAT